MQPVLLPLLPFLTIGTTGDWRVAQVARLAYALENLLSCQRVPAGEGAWDGRCPQEKLWVRLEPTGCWVGSECGLPTEALTRCRVGKLELPVITAQYVHDDLSCFIRLGVLWDVNN